MWILAKLIFSGLITKLGNALTFIIERWRVFLPLAILCAVLWYVHALRNERDAAVKQLNDYVTEQKTAADKRKAENLAKETSTQLVLNAIAANHTAQINSIRKQYESLKHDKDLSDASVDNWRDSLRNELPKNSGLSSIPKTAEGTAEVGADSYTTTLRTACSVTTADYNALYDAWDGACKIHGCK